MPQAGALLADAIAQPTEQAILPIGEAAAILAEALESGNLIFAAADEVRASAIARALAALAPDAEIAFCPGSDALPGERSPASPANVGQRVAALRHVRLAQYRDLRRRIACITTGEALARAYPSPEAFDAAPPRIEHGEPLDLPALCAQLIQTGYIADERVDEPGEVALRGQVLDVYPADADGPIRIEVVDGRVASIRSYDAASQRTITEIASQELGRVAEPEPSESDTTLADHIPGAAVGVEPAAEDRRKRFLSLAADAARRRPARALRAIVDEKRWRASTADRPSLPLLGEGDPPPRFVEAHSPLQAFTRFARAAIAAGNTILMLGSARDLRFLRRRIAAVLKLEITDVASWAEARDAAPGSLVALEAPVDRGFRRSHVAAIAAADLLGSRAERDDARAADDPSVFGFGDIRIGDVVVHEDHGIGTIAALDEMPDTGDGEPGDAIAITYADGGVRLVPVGEADRLWRYGGDADAVTLDKLDGSTWNKRRLAIEEAIAETAKAMTAMAADRARQTAPAIEPDIADYERFAAGFPYAETRDQARAIQAVRTDLATGVPMDRLVIGDVGFGKTEVALRAAALAILSGYQVAIAAPTTVLARQHLETFTERFEEMGTAVAALSRLSTAAEKKRVKAGLADGSIRLVIGTSAVAGKGIAYRNLALVVIDEEQRFGAADKARLRALGAGHVLTLSATPIPRTLQAALIGVQQLSVIATPPARRQPIRTAVGPFDKETVRTALLRERSRAGQSFVVVPRIEDMAPLAALLEKLVPELDLVQAHGKMPPVEIEQAMVGFGRGEGDVLLATNIIEAGLDVPRANTMIIWRADRFGLSQLHQLRGRVGRGSRRGQVFLLTEADKEIAPRTLKRLRTLEAFDRLGAGFAISAQDLDMRGAGDLLGEAQAGHMKLIGIDLYQHLLEAALRAARGDDAERWVPDLHLGLEGRLPGSWIPDAELRITFYVRLARVSDAGAVDNLEAELQDRFGALPPEAHVALSIARVRIGAHAMGIARIDAGPAAIALTPRPGHAERLRIPGLVVKGERLLLAERIADPVERLKRVEALLEQLGGAHAGQMGDQGSKPAADRLLTA